VRRHTQITGKKWGSSPLKEKKNERLGLSEREERAPDRKAPLLEKGRGQGEEERSGRQGLSYVAVRLTTCSIRKEKSTCWLKGRRRGGEEGASHGIDLVRRRKTVPGKEGPSERRKGRRGNVQAL